MLDIERTKRQLGIALVLVATQLAACGSSDDGNTAPEKCNALVSLLCDRAVECAIEPRQTCIDSAAKQVQCGQATAVAASYDACMSDLKGITRRTLSDFPDHATARGLRECDRGAVSSDF